MKKSVNNIEKIKSDVVRLNLQSDLKNWYEFFEISDKLEESSFSDCPYHEHKNGEDITEKKCNWKKYNSEVLEPKFYKAYKKDWLAKNKEAIQKEAKKRYDENQKVKDTQSYKNAEKQAYKVRRKERQIRKYEQSPKWMVTIFSACGILCLLGGFWLLLAACADSESVRTTDKIVAYCLFGAGGGILLLYFIKVFIGAIRAKKMSNGRYSLSDDQQNQLDVGERTVEWFAKQVTEEWLNAQQPAFDKQFAKDEKEFISAEKKFDEVISEVGQLKDLVVKKTNIPAAYRNENDIKQLLVYVVNRRADTLKEAINLLEDEKYKSNVVKQFHNIGKTIVQLNNNMAESFSSLQSSLNSSMASIEVAQRANLQAQMKQIRESQVISTKLTSIDASVKLNNW